MNARAPKAARRAALAACVCCVGMLAAAAAPVCAGEELGRLFFTPERRQALDRQRELNLPEKQETPVDPTLTINGVVTRSSGKRTAWVNGVAQNDREKPGGVAITPNAKEPGKVLVRPDEAPEARAKVGETVNRNTGEATDLLGGGRIDVRRQTPK